jgi:hypothetical protein
VRGVDGKKKGNVGTSRDSKDEGRGTRRTSNGTRIAVHLVRVREGGEVLDAGRIPPRKTRKQWAKKGERGGEKIATNQSALQL